LGIVIRVIETGARVRDLMRCEVTVNDACVMSVGDVLDVHVLLRKE
jgi:hypothetical protein